MKLTELLIVSGAAFLLALPFAIQAQAAAKSPTGLQVSVGDVTDIRSTGSVSSDCKVELKLNGDAAADAGAVRGVHLTEALDELGRDLLRPTKDDDTSCSSRDCPRRHNGPLRAQVNLSNPSRNATIKLLKGEVELFSPTEANGSILTFKNVLKHPAEPLRSPALSKHGITLMYLTKESYEARKKEMEEQQKANGNDLGNKLGEAFGEFFKGMFGGMMSSSSSNTLTMYIKAEKRVLGIEFQDAQGKALRRQGGWSDPDSKQTELAGPPPPDAQLIILLAVPEAVKSYPFELHDIPLP